MREDMEAALADLTRDPALDPAPPLDPLTGQAFNELPAGLKTGQPQDPTHPQTTSTPISRRKRRTSPRPPET